MSKQARRRDSDHALSVISLHEEGSQRCPSLLTEDWALIDSKKQLRAKQSQRELYQNEFPAEFR